MCSYKLAIISCLFLCGCAVPVKDAQVSEEWEYVDGVMMQKKVINRRPGIFMFDPQKYVRVSWKLQGPPYAFPGYPWRHILISSTNLTDWQIRTQWVQRIYPGTTNLSVRVPVNKFTEYFRAGVALQ